MLVNVVLKVVQSNYVWKSNCVEAEIRSLEITLRVWRRRTGHLNLIFKTFLFICKLRSKLLSVSKFKRRPGCHSYFLGQ